MRHGKAVAVLGTEAQRHREVHREPRDPAPLNKRHILSNHATGGRRPDVSGGSARVEPHPHHEGTEAPRATERGSQEVDRPLLPFGF